jgi:hypothetical protein
MKNCDLGGEVLQTCEDKGGQLKHKVGRAGMMWERLGCGKD